MFEKRSYKQELLVTCGMFCRLDPSLRHNFIKAGVHGMHNMLAVANWNECCQVAVAEEGCIARCLGKNTVSMVSIDRVPPVCCEHYIMV